MSLNVRLFPPQVLSDLNFFNVRSEKELAFRLRTLQRVATAAIGAYLMDRYMPILANKLGSSSAALGEALITFFVGYVWLSYPTFNLIVFGVGEYFLTRNGVLCIRDKEIGRVFINVVGAGVMYYFSQSYRCSGLENKDPYLEPGPNFLERLFQKVEDQVTPYLFRRFYTESV